ncbi:MAG: hypothetical protein WC942_08745 [Clostridia bacterium]|jgi:hypothetical protein
MLKEEHKKKIQYFLDKIWDEKIEDRNYPVFFWKREDNLHRITGIDERPNGNMILLLQDDTKVNFEECLDLHKECDRDPNHFFDRIKKFKEDKIDW